MKSLSSHLKQTSNKKLLILFPHPDDETVMASGLIQEALSLDFEVKVVCVTNGSLGQIHVHGHGRSVVQIRREELKRAMRLLGVTDYEFWKFCDGHLRESETWKQETRNTIQDFNPGIVVSYGPDGASGHPDHLALGKFVHELWTNQDSFQLVWPSFTGTTLEYLKQKTTTTDRIVPPNFEHKLTNSQIKTKIQALHSHASQDLKTVIQWMEQDTNEYFALPDSKIDYDFGYVEFDLGN